MEILILSALTLVASIVGTLTGFGTSTIMVPVVSLFLPLPVALFLVGIIHFFGDIWKVFLFKHAVKWKLLLAFGVPGVLASLIGAAIVLSTPPAVLQKILGLILISYTLLLVIKPKFNLPQNGFWAAIGGALSGFLA